MVDKIVDVALRKSVRRSKQYDGYFEDYYTAILRRSKEIIVLDVGGTKFYVLKIKAHFENQFENEKAVFKNAPHLAYVWTIGE